MRPFNGCTFLFLVTQGQVCLGISYLGKLRSISSSTILCLFLLSFSYSYAQGFEDDISVDELKTMLIENAAEHDTTKLQVISNVMNGQYSDSDPEYYQLNDMIGSLAYKHYKDKRHNNPKEQKVYTEWLAGYYSHLANKFIKDKADRAKALALHDKSVALYKSIKSYDEMHVALLSKARFYIKIQKEEEAIPILFEALKYFEKDKIHYARQMSYVYPLLAKVYAQQLEFQKAIAYSKQAISYFDLCYAADPFNGTLNLKALSLNNIATCYGKLKDYRQMRNYSLQSAEIAKKIGYETTAALALSNAGDAEMKQSNFQLAEKHYQEALSMKGLSETIDKRAIVVSEIGLGRLSFQKKDYNQAKVYAEHAFELSKNTGDVDLKKNAADLMYQLSLARKDFEKALQMYRYSEKIVDSGQIEASKNALEQQLLRYNFEKKELKLKLANQKAVAAKNNWLIGLSGVLLLLILGGIFYYRNARQKQSIAALEKNQIKQKLLITQMNPHFIFNSVQNIRNLIDNHKNADAVKYLDQFSVLTRQILENANEHYISLEEEVAMLENYLSIQQLLYNHKFDFAIRVEDDLDPESVFLPPMLTQPFIENAIKHGLSAVSQNGKIDIHFFLDAGKLFFEVTDNGKGFDHNQTTSNHKSLAMTITKERLIGYTKNQDFVVQTDNLKDDDQKVVGAKVRFEIPYIYEN